MVAKKVFLDTNIVLDIIDKNRLNHMKAKGIWEILIKNHSTIMISEDMLSTLFYINKDDSYTLEFFKLIQNRWDIVSSGTTVISNAIELSLEKTLDFEDVLQCLCAKENGCDVFITNDKKFYNCGIEIMTIEEFLITVSQKRN
jgi:predicted nucleic acid-binding protein